MTQIECCAKLNLYLRLVARRPDGYHDIDTVFQEINLADTLIWSPGGPGLSLEVMGADLGETSENLVMKAGRLFAHETGLEVKGTFQLMKRIPAGGGLGGGSSDAAGALKILNTHYGSPLTENDLSELGSRLGSDIPFFIRGGCQRGTGRGTYLEPVQFDGGPGRGFLLAPPFSISTGKVYGACRVPERVTQVPELGENHLLEAALAVSPAFSQLWGLLTPVFQEGFFFMTGSGSTMVWLTEQSEMTPEQAQILDLARVSVIPFHFSADFTN